MPSRINKMREGISILFRIGTVNTMASFNFLQSYSTASKYRVQTPRAFTFF